MRKSIVLIGSLLFAAAFAATVSHSPSFVFAGEPVTVTYHEYGPLNAGFVTCVIGKESREIAVPHLKAGESFSADIMLNAPASGGEYNLACGGAVENLEVHAPTLVLDDVVLSPASIEPRQTTELHYTVRNEGSLTVYNVRGVVSFLGDPSDYEFGSSETLLYESMAPNAERTEVVQVTARESASGSGHVSVTVYYEFNGEEHVLTEYAELSVGSFPWVTLVIALVALFVVVKVVSSKL
ncbi:MAG: hypothetical protein JW834_00390 [Candidatus Diapherotrites archaeon]|nr:hypothetical protein [Candidatus Diapherotrites archaeon]